MLRFVLTLTLLCVVCVPAVAQDLAPPPPPPEIDQNEGDAPSVEAPDPDNDDLAQERPIDDETALAITAPLAGQRVGTSTVIEGTAPVGATVEVRVNGELESRMKVDSTGTFEVALAGLEPNSKLRIELVQIDGDAEILAATSIVARTGEPTAEIAPPPPSDPEVEADVTPEQPRSVVESESEPTQPAVTPMIGREARAALSTAGGVGMGFLGAIFGFLGGAFLAIATSDGDGDFSELGYLLFGTLAGYAIGVPAGVYMTSYLLDGNGSILLTVLATYGGLVLGALGSAALFSNAPSDSASFAVFSITTIMGAAAGAITFELTSDPSRRVKEAEAAGLSLTPTVAPSFGRGGIVFGVGGTF